MPNFSMRNLWVSASLLATMLLGSLQSEAQYFSVRAVNDQQVVIVPGTATGNVITNDQIFNRNVCCQFFDF